MKEQLREAGLTENEAKVYIALLRLGPSNAGLISKRSGLHRRVVYDTISLLSEKGLVGYILKNNVRLFSASDPKRVLQLIKEKVEHVSEIMGEMEALFVQTKEKEETNFYKGKNGLKSVMEDQINMGKEIFVIGASPLAYDILRFYFKWFDKRRVEKKVRVKMIFSKTKERMKIPYSEIRYLPEKYSSPLAVNIYGDKVALILWSKQNPLAIVIRDREISEGYKKYFEMMWKSARKG
jgi:HTH-type transcriptional regulator, sugar sensing transcriptional regulator